MVEFKDPKENKDIQDDKKNEDSSDSKETKTDTTSLESTTTQNSDSVTDSSSDSSNLELDHDYSDMEEYSEKLLKVTPHKKGEASYEDLKANVSTYLSLPDIEKIDQAYNFAKQQHQFQKRQSGEPYIVHPVTVANILSELRLDKDSIVAALLHDVVEDTPVSLEEIGTIFGKNVQSLVDGLTKLSKISFRSHQERLAENFRKMIVAMAKDLRVILIKLADRLHNMRTINALPPDRRERISQETLDIYAPLANRLGLYSIKSELEDLCLRQLKPDVYTTLKNKVASTKSARKMYIEEVKSILEAELKKNGFSDVIVYGRPKHFYSIYKKMIDRKLEFEDIHDLFAFRVIANSIKDCYEILGIVHALWTPMPGRYKDYIAMPKPNMYQSLHTTVIRPNGEPAEIQIRTREMHIVCEYGIAAHWAYKEKKDVTKESKSNLEKFSWFRRIVEWQHELKDPAEFLEAVKVDLFEEEMFVFTPRGDVISLPLKASALDFAFSIHTQVGLHTIGAKINGSMVPIKKLLHSGDIVEIITSPNQKPTQDWLNFVYSSRAKSKIRNALRSEERERSKRLGKELLNQAMEDRGLNLEKLIKAGSTDSLVKVGRESNFDDMLVTLGYGWLNPKELLEKAFPSGAKVEGEKKDQEIKEMATKEEASTPSIDIDKHRSTNGVLVSGLKNILVTFAKCCSPIPGEEIIGCITRGKGVTIHRANCPRALELDPKRRIDVSWAAEATTGEYSAYIKVYMHDRAGILAEITSIISNCGVNIKRVSADSRPNSQGTCEFELSLHRLHQLQAVIKKIESLKSVISVERKNIFKH